MERAYTLLTVKSVDDEQRTIIGIATTPTPDRMGDIVEVNGAEFKLPIPLLWQHRTDQPIGHVVEVKKGEDGIWITARIEREDQPGKLKERLDEAWQSVKKGLVRGLSIGFKSLESSFLDDTNGGIRFIKWLWLELSVVTIPANGEATIQTIKSIDSALLAASGREQHGVKTSAGVTAHRRPAKAEEARHMKKTIAEQISAFEATRQAKAARMDEIMDAAAEKGETLDEAAKESYDALDAEVKEIDEHLVRLHAREKSQKTVAVPAVGDSIDSASRSRGGDAVRVQVVGGNVPKWVPFVRLAMANIRSTLTHVSPVDIAAANKQWATETPEVELCLRAAVAAGTTTGTTWAAPLVEYQVLASGFAEYLRPLTILGRINGLRNVPFKVKIPRQTGGATVGWVGENKSKPVSALAFDSVTLDHFKVAGIVALSRELVMLSTPSAEALVRDDLSRAIAQYVDDSLTDPDRAEVATVSPASLTNGVTPVAATGTAYTNFAADWRSLMALFLAANITPDTVIMSQTQALAFSLIETSLGVRRFPDLTITGGNFLGLNAIASENIQWTEDSPQEGFPIIVLRADEIMLADEGGVSIDVSTEASVQMDSAPTDPITASQVLVSFWQQNLVGIRAERMINWKKRRPAAVQFINYAKYIT